MPTLPVPCCETPVSAALQGRRYWQLERRLCADMLQAAAQSSAGAAAAKPATATATVPFTLADVLTTHESKSFDYRVLNLLLHKLAGTPYDHAVLAFLRVDEMLVDIGDDLVDYEDDVCANSFNIYRAYIALFGAGEAQLKLVRASCGRGVP